MEKTIKTPIICTTVCRNLVDFQKFIQTFKENTPEPYKLIIIDNGSPKEVTDYVRQFENDSIKVLKNETNLGLGISTDQAAHLTEGYEYVFRVDTDVEFLTPDWTLAMMDIIDRNPEVGQVGTPINTGGNRIRRMGFLETDVVVGCCQCVSRRAIDRIETYLKDNKEELIHKIKNYIDNATTGERIKYLLRFLHYVKMGEGYWDPGFYYGVDDFDYSLMIRWLGFKLAVAEKVRIIHKSASENPEWKEVRHKNVWDGWNYFRTKWEIFLDYWDWKDTWDDLLPNRSYKKEYLDTRL